MSNYSFHVMRLVAFFKGEFLAQTKNFILWSPVFQAAGIMLYFSLECEPCVLLVSLIAIVGVVLVAVITADNRLAPFSIVVLMIVGFICAYTKTTIFAVKDPAITGKTYLADKIGTLSELNYKQHHVQLLFCDVRGLAQKNICIRLAARTAIDPMIKVGDLVKFSGVVYPPEAAITSNGFDFAREAYFKGIHAIGFTTSEVKLYKSGEGLGIGHTVERIRHKIYERFFSGLSRDSTEVLSAVIIGKKQGIREEVLKNVRDSGLAHLLAISGLHLSFVAGMVFVFFRYVFACSEKLTLNYNTKKLCAAIAIVISFGYLLLAGMPTSAFRAFIMVAMTLLGIIVDRRHSSMRSISVAASIIMFYAPEAVLSPSFQMSFTAAIALIAFGNMSYILITANSIAKYLFATAASSFIASVATAPFVLYHFQSFSLVGVLANVIAVPMTTFAIIPLAIIYQITYNTPFAPVVAYLLEKLVGFLLQVAKYAAAPEWSSLHYKAISAESVLIITFGFLVISLWQGSLRIVGGVSIIVLGILLAIFHQAPDIVCDGNAVVVKEGDAKMYFALRRGSPRKLRYLQWAKSNGQKEILTQSDAQQNERKLVCEEGCVYSGRVLITCNAGFLLQQCKNVDLVIYNGVAKYPDECVHVKHIDLSDFKAYGVHYVKLRGESIFIDRAITLRPWHRNAQGFPYGAKRITLKKKECITP